MGTGIMLDRQEELSPERFSRPIQPSYPCSPRPNPKRTHERACLCCKLQICKTLMHDAGTSKHGLDRWRRGGEAAGGAATHNPDIPWSSYRCNHDVAWRS